MPQTYQSPVRIYKHPFELVMKAYHKRFPTCPQIPIFVGSDIIYEYHSPDGAEEIIERKCTLNVEAPYLLKKVAGIEYIYFMQRNHLNLRDRTLSIEASNISFSSRIAVVENCKYYVHGDNPDWTCFEQSASLDVKSFFGFETTVEKIAVKQYAANIAKGKEILEFFIDDLIAEGVTYVPIWEAPSALAIAANEAASFDDVVERGVRHPAHRSPADSAIGEGSQQEEEELHKVMTLGEKDGRGGSEDVVAAQRTNSPLSGTAEERMPEAELKRRRSGSQIRASAPPSQQSVATGSFSTTTRPSAVTTNPASATTTVALAAAAVSVGRARSIDECDVTQSAVDTKLEADYIQRFLGPLTPLEESRLCELKYGLMSTHKGKLPNDAHLLRFLRARDFDVQKASQMVLNSLLWRKQHNIDKILQEFVPPVVLTKYLPGSWHHSDNEGRPLFVLCLGQMDIKGLLRAVGLEAVVKSTLSICEQGLLKAAEATRQHGKPISTISLLVDLEGLSLRHLWRPGVQCLLRIIETVEAHYPETLGRVLVTRAPRVFPVLWTLVSPFIDENTTKKFVFNTERLVLAELEKYIPHQFLPDFLGGPSPFESPAGSTPGHVPKSQYLPLNEEVLRENEDILKSLYNTSIITRGTPKELCVWIADRGSVLTWDFNVVKGDCEFIVYYTEKKIEPPPVTHSAANNSGDEFPGVLLTAAAEAVDRVAEAVAEVASFLGSTHMPPCRLVAAAPELGPDQLQVVRKTTAFSEGDSMQGSYFCDRVGTYILQWRHPADPTATGSRSGTLTVVQSPQQQHQASTSAAAVASTYSIGPGPDIAAAGPSGHAAAGGGGGKCRLLWFHEVLDSDEFRGSVASLASCRESFSSIPSDVLASPNPKRQSPLKNVPKKCDEQQ